MSTSERIQELRQALRQVEDIIKSDTDWEMKYDLVFGHYQSEIRPLLKVTGVSLDWYDPDTTYREDAEAFAYACKDLLDRLPDLP